MALPKISDLVTYINKALTGNDWNTNWQKIVNWLSLGETDIKVNSIETNSMTNNGSLEQNGNVVIDGNLQAGNVTANYFIGDGSQLTNIQSESKFSYTPFTVNSAKSYNSYIDISDGTKIVFDVDETNPLIVTLSGGKTLTITQINDFDVANSGLVAGDYYIFVDEETNGGACYLKKCTIFRQSITPAGDNGDIWFDTRKEPYTVYEKTSGNWFNEEYNKVPLALVTLAKVNDVMNATNISYLPLNQNGYNVNHDTKIFGISREAINSIVAGSADTVYRDRVYPTVVICGAKEGTDPYDWWFKLEVSTNNSTWKTIMATNGLDGGWFGTTIIGANVYWRYRTGLGANAHVEYAPLKEL